ncbi:MAG: hypothetical protein V4659_11625 [Pseudomonadota bacterium]
MRTLLSLAAALCLAAPLPAQQAEVVVTARNKEVRTVLRTVLRTSGYNQLGRFEGPVCPGVSGAPRGFGLTLLKLIRANAERAGIDLEKPGCKPTALVLFIGDPNALVTRLHAKMPGYFGEITPQDLATLSTGDAAIRSWHVVKTVGRDGEELAEMESFNGQVVGKGVKVVRNAAATRTYENTRQDMTLGFAVLDNDAIVGKTLQQLADIATMHLFLDIGASAGADAGPGSILSLFEARAADVPVPTGLGGFDWGALSGTYRARQNNYRATVQRGRIAKAIKKAEAGD